MATLYSLGDDFGGDKVVVPPYLDSFVCGLKFTISFSTTSFKCTPGGWLAKMLRLWLGLFGGPSNDPFGSRETPTPL